MTLSPNIPASFEYEARTDRGQVITGSIDAPDIGLARQQLEALRLSVQRIAPAAAPRAGKPLRGEDFAAFNQQLAYLTAASLPVEQGLRLIAQDMRRGRLANSIRQVAEDLEHGVPLPEAFEARRGQFPPLYGRLIEAGIKSNNLPGILLNLGQHLELVQRLRSAVWRAAVYPMMVLVGAAAVLTFLSIVVLPQFHQIYDGFRVDLPQLTKVIFGLGGMMPAILIGVVAAALLVPATLRLARAHGLEQAITDSCLLPVPLIGPVLRRNLLARWCAALHMGVSAGLDLPAAVELASEAMGSPRLQADGRVLIETLRAGRSLTEATGLRIVPPAVTMMIQLASQRGDMPTATATLGQMYQQQAEMRLARVQAILGPLLVIVTAGIIAVVIVAMFMPMISFIGAVSSSPGKK